MTPCGAAHPSRQRSGCLPAAAHTQPNRDSGEAAEGGDSIRHLVTLTRVDFFTRVGSARSMTLPGCPLRNRDGFVSPPN